MKKSTVLCVSIAGLASVAGAQDFSLTLVAESDFFDGSTTQTIGVYGDANVGTHMLGGAFELTSSGNTMVDNMSWTAASWSSFNTDGGYAGNGDYNQVIFGQLVIPGVPPFDVPAAGSELGSAIGYFQIDLAEPVNLLSTISFNLIASDPFSLEAIDINTGETFRSNDGNLILNGLAIPAPSTLGLLGFAGLVGARRRR
ncbi:MAG: PEP-CTERM sorting domain-containing protein [Phycisphaerales bacterium JB052]